jgi:hypothetical protein
MNHVSALQVAQLATMHARRKKYKVNINKGIRQRCNLLPALFNMYMEEVIKEIEEQGIKVNGEEINML